MKSCGGRCDPGQSFETRPKLFYTIERERGKKRPSADWFLGRAQLTGPLWLQRIAIFNLHQEGQVHMCWSLKYEYDVMSIMNDILVWLYYMIILYGYTILLYYMIIYICINRIWSNQELCGRQSMEPLLSEIIPWPPQNAECRRFGGRNVALSLPAPQKIRVEWREAANQEKWGEIQHNTMFNTTL